MVLLKYSGLWPNKIATILLTAFTHHNNDVWGRWRLKSPASPLFTQPFIQGAGQRKHQSSASTAFVRGIHRSPVNSTHKGPVTRKLFSFDDVIMCNFLKERSWICFNFSLFLRAHLGLEHRLATNTGAFQYSYPVLPIFPIFKIRRCQYHVI